MGWRNRRRDKIIFRSSSPEITVWKPGSEYSLGADMDDYEYLTDISHVVHFEDFKAIYDMKSFKNYPVSDHHHSFLAGTSTSCIFFGPKQPPNNHNWYGNVSFNVHPVHLMDKFFKHGLKWYYVETVDYSTNSCSRILFTTKDYPNLRPYYPGKDGALGGPWYFREDGRMFHLTNARRFDGSSSSRFGHVLEFMIELPDHLLPKLSSMCKIEAVNHSDAMNGYRKCRKYRSGRYWEECPSDWNTYFTGLQLKKLFSVNSY